MQGRKEGVFTNETLVYKEKAAIYAASIFWL